MELTQLQGQTIGKKFTAVSGQINIGSASGNQIQNVGLPSNAAQINIQNGNAEIRPMQTSSPVFVNGNQVQKTSPVKFGDTVSVGPSNNIVLGAHPKGETLNAGQIGSHLESLNFSGNQIADLTNRIFDFHGNQAIHKKMISLILILSVLLFGVVFGYIQLMNIGDDLQKEKNVLNGKLIEINSQLESASLILGKDLVSGGDDLECDPEEEECDDFASGSDNNLSLFSQIKNLEKNILIIRSEQKKAISEMKKVAANPKDEISKELKKEQEEKIESIEENKKNISLINENFSKIIKNLKDDIEGFVDFKIEMKSDLKDFKKVSGDFNSDKNVLEEENKIRDNKIKESQGDIDDLEKKDDKIDIELKKLQEEINSLELKIKNLK